MLGPPSHSDPRGRRGRGPCTVRSPARVPRALGAGLRKIDERVRLWSVAVPSSRRSRFARMSAPGSRTGKAVRVWKSAAAASPPAVR